jgi:hypothetical protein
VHETFGQKAHAECRLLIDHIEPKLVRPHA